MKKGQTNTNYLPVIVTLIVLLVGFIAWRSNSSLNQTLVPVKQTENMSEKTVDLLLSPAMVNSAVGVEQSVDLNMSTGGAKVTAVEVVLTYDPKIIGTPSVTKGSYFSNVLSSPKISNGKIVFTYAVAPDDTGKTISGTIATIKFKPIAKGVTNMTFTSDTSAVAEGITDDVIKSTMESQINVVSK